MASKKQDREKLYDALQAECNENAMRAYGYQLARRATDILNACLATTTSWERAVAVLRKNKLKSRSHNIAYKMFAEFVAGIAAGGLKTDARRKRRGSVV